MRGRGTLRHLAEETVVASVSCFVAVYDLGRWEGSLTVLQEYAPVTTLWFQGVREYLLDVPGVCEGAVALNPLDFLDPAARASYTFRGLSLAPGS